MAPGPIQPTPSRPGRRHLTFSPTQLRVYLDCPERYYRQYIANERVKAEFSRPVQRGSAVHKVLAAVFDARQSGITPDPELRPLAERFLSRQLYLQAAEGEAWSKDVAIVLHLVQRALEYVPVDATIVAVERSFDYMFSTRSPVNGATVVGKVDLLIRRPENVIEHLEFKTGWAQADPLQEVICRIGVCEAYLHAGLPIYSTTYQLSTGQLTTLSGDRDVLEPAYAEIVETIGRIWDATRWAARENPRCVTCNYRTTLCSILGEWSRPSRSRTGDG